MQVTAPDTCLAYLVRHAFSSRGTPALNFDEMWLQPTHDVANLRSNTRTEPSAETEANTPTPPQAMSYTSLS